MKILSAIFLLLVSTAASVAGQGFLTQQKNYARVRQAIDEKGEAIAAVFARHGLRSDSVNILIVAYKAEKRLDIYAGKPDADRYLKIASYNICRLSGAYGPKRRQGDGQIPEGFYRIDRFNPSSSYHLSLGINYPNRSDKIKSTARRLGGDIFIHGSCVTIGCLPMTDEGIKEIYLYAVYARDSGQKDIPVYIFPFEMTDKNLKSYKKRYSADAELAAFWDNLKEGYDKFISGVCELTVSVDHSGNYLFR